MYNAFRVPPKCGAYYVPPFSADVANVLVLYLSPPHMLVMAWSLPLPLPLPLPLQPQLKK